MMHESNSWCRWCRWLLHIFSHTFPMNSWYIFCQSTLSDFSSPGKKCRQYRKHLSNYLNICYGKQSKKSCITADVGLFAECVCIDGVHTMTRWQIPRNVALHFLQHFSWLIHLSSKIKEFTRITIENCRGQEKNVKKSRKDI